MRPQDVQIPKGMELTVSLEDYCRIQDFMEDEDIENPFGIYTVKLQYCTWRGNPQTTSRGFQSKTGAEEFAALVQSINGASVIEGAEFQLIERPGGFSNKRIVGSDGLVPVKALPRGREL